MLSNHERTGYVQQFSKSHALDFRSNDQAFRFSKIMSQKSDFDRRQIVWFSFSRLSFV